MDCYPGDYLHHIVLCLQQNKPTKARWKKKTGERMAPTPDTYKQKIIQQGYARA
jgi:hypothetical protein